MSSMCLGSFEPQAVYQLALARVCVGIY
ncbi:hypothetical protein V12B01_13445 [Vibrio splendidus 12B01]|nr:hypothetical protein V12B01_13445 [Vibrio splendidus 12B01]